MTFRDEIGKAWSILKLDAKVMSRVSKDKNATKYSLIFAFIAGLAVVLFYITIQLMLLLFLFIVGSAVKDYGVVGEGIFRVLIQSVFSLFYPFAYPISMLLVAGMYHIIAKLFGGKGEYLQLLRIYGYMFVGTWFVAIPIVGILLLPFLAIWVRGKLRGAL